MARPEYMRSRLLRAADLLRKLHIDSASEIGVAYYRNAGAHVIEITHRASHKVVRWKADSCVDLPTYPELLEAVLTRFRV